MKCLTSHCASSVFERVNVFSALQVCSLCHVLLLFVFCFLHNLLGWLQVWCVLVLPSFTCHSLLQKQPAAAAAKECALSQFPFFPLLALRKGRNHIGEHLWIHQSVSHVLKHKRIKKLCRALHIITWRDALFASFQECWWAGVAVGWVGMCVAEQQCPPAPMDRSVRGHQQEHTARVSWFSRTLTGRLCHWFLFLMELITVSNLYFT